jgi:hypothetical protein
MNQIKKRTFIKALFCFTLFSTVCSATNNSIRVKFEGIYTEKKWAIKELNPDLPSDWSLSGFLTFEMYSTTTQRFNLNLYDAQGIRRLEIQPFQGVWIRASIPLVHFQKMNTTGMDMAEMWKTPRPGYWIGFTGVAGTISHIDSLGVAMSLPVGSPTLEIRNIRLTRVAEDSVLTSKPLVDEFGQWIPADWEGKANTIDDLQTAWNEEDLALKSEPFSSTKYGGFIGTKAKPTGFFHVEKIDEKWWFVDPEGLLFFSTGSCCINSESDATRTEGRENIFPAKYTASSIKNANQPKPASGNSAYSMNLYRRFGPEWYQKWTKNTVRRMDSWGINTIANWSDKNLAGSHRKAYVATLAGWGIENGIMGMPDVYDSAYVLKVEASALRQCVPIKDDPFLLGYFIGNEPPWPGMEAELVSNILNGNDSPMKAALGNYLASGDTPERRKAFVFETYSKFIGIVDAAIRKSDPNHLNFGIRFGDVPPAEIIRESKKYFDVFCINHYGYAIGMEEIQKIYDQSGLPIIIGEFHFGTPARGLAPGLAQVKNQEERGVAYRYYVENAASHPAVIGTHWFQWIDQPSTGRKDGENYNIGFVDVTDCPYKELINAAKETYKRLPDIHSGKTAPVSREAKTQ